MRAEGVLEHPLKVLAMRGSKGGVRRSFFCRVEEYRTSRQLEHHWPGEGHSEDPTQAS